MYNVGFWNWFRHGSTANTATSLTLWQHIDNCNTQHSTVTDTRHNKRLTDFVSWNNFWWTQETCQTNENRLKHRHRCYLTIKTVCIQQLCSHRCRRIHWQLTRSLSAMWAGTSIDTLGNNLCHNGRPRLQQHCPSFHITTHCTTSSPSTAMFHIDPAAAWESSSTSYRRKISTAAVFTSYMFPSAR